MNVTRSAVALDDWRPKPDTVSAKGFVWWLGSGFFAGICVVALGTAGHWIYNSERPVVSHHAVVKGTLTQVGAPLDGQLIQLLVENNQQVKKGDVLARLDDQPTQARLARANVELKRLQKLHALEQSEIDTARARQNEQGEQSQVSNGDRIEASAANRLSATHANRLAIETLKLREAGLHALGQQIALLEESVASANADIELARIRAPEDGWVSHRIVEAGGSVRAGDPIMALWVGERVWIEAWVAQPHLADLQVGSEVEVRFIAYKGKSFSGRVQHVEALPENTPADTRLAVNCDAIFGEVPPYRVQISIPADDLRVVPGLTALVNSHGAATSEMAKPMADNRAAPRAPELIREPEGDVVAR